MQTADSLNRDGRRRLYPSLTNPNWLVLRRRREIFRGWIARINDRQLDVLDVGGRVQPYRPVLEGCVRRYIAIDLQKTMLVNIAARAEQMPLAANQFDLVICTQMLEYAPEPAAVVDEIHRVLKPGGCLFLSVPSISPQDADHDAWRFLPAALRNLLSGFSTYEIAPEGGSVIGFFRSVNVCLSIFVRYRVLRSMFQLTLCPLLNVAGEIFNFLSGSNNDQFCANYSVWARK
jgi:SAM-dependent methyltransferase